MNKIQGKKLPRSFYLQPTLSVARQLIGKTIVFHHPDGLVAGDIVETEAYVGKNDPACHASVGKTPRNEVMFGIGGYSYIYFIYGMYHCFNIVTEKSGFPAAVLVRAVEPVTGIDIMAAHSPASDTMHTNGPGKFCRAFQLTREYNGVDLLGETLYIIDRNQNTRDIQASARIGIKQGTDKLWRFFDGNSPFVSRK